MVPLALTILLSSCTNETSTEIADVSLQQQSIIDGTLSHDPVVVGLHRYTKKWGGAVSSKPFCTGTLIGNNVILTAAHCLDKSNDTSPTAPWKPSELAIYVGDDPSLDLLNNLYMVQELRIHGQYDKFMLTNDIGLVRLKTRVSDATPVRPLPPSQEIQSADVGTLNLHIVGFGQSSATDSTSYGVELEGDVLLSAILANNQIEHTYNSSDPNNDNTICFGDSGGPAFVTRNGERFVAGVASYTTYPVCANTGIHTKVDAYSSFISDFLSLCSTETDCDDNNPCTDDSCDSELGCLNIDNGTCSCLSTGAECVLGEECCSGKCLGKPGNRVCK